MSPLSKPAAPPFTVAERAWLGQELGVHFGAADGLFLRTCAGRGLGFRDVC